MLWQHLLVSLLGSFVVIDAVTITVNTTHIKSRDWVRVTYTGVPKNDRHGCFIGVFAPATANVSSFTPHTKSEWSSPFTETAPIKWIHCANSANGNFGKTGNGAYDFTLINMREDVVFWLFYNGLNKPKAQAKTATITFESPNQPSQVRLARTHSPTEMRVSWTSGEPEGAQVKWSQKADGPLMNIQSAETETYTAQDLCGPPANAQGFFKPGWLHSAIITGLKEGVPVRYSVGSKKAGWVPETSFKPAAPAAPHTPIKVLVVGDVGVTEPDHCNYHWEEPDAYQTFQFMYDRTKTHQLALHVGDLSYATGYETKWELFMDYVAGVASYVPYMTGLGNHERDWPGTGNAIGGIDSGGECGKPTEARFKMPTRSHIQGDGWYSFDQASAHFIMINTEMAVAENSDQYLWLQQDLMKVNRSVTPWVIVSGHRPMYLGDGISSHFQVLESMLYQYKVDLVLWAHIHYAMCTCPVYKGECKTKASNGYDAPVHAIIGNGGQSLTKPGFSRKYVKYGASYWGGNEIVIESATKMSLNFYVDGTNHLNYTHTITREWPRKY